MLPVPAPKQDFSGASPLPAPPIVFAVTEAEPYVQVQLQIPAGGAGAVGHHCLFGTAAATVSLQLSQRTGGYCIDTVICQFAICVTMDPIFAKKDLLF